MAFGLDWHVGDQVVISNEEFPSNRVVWEALEPQGVEVIKVDLHGDDPETSLLNACGPHTRLLSISAVQYASGLRPDLQRLGDGCRQRCVLFCIDAIHQLGALPFDVQACQCAFAMADGHKWLLGPEGLGVFYCRSDLRAQLEQVICAQRGAGIRLSPHFYNEARAIEETLSLLHQLATG